ncbi:chondroitinase family polysaccharide lyase [Paraferrimonas sp. SM1919]|uniref:chondroitinase family polysaccharide lyase n=1 Tax=Paraferrimonas sp. SM1919 TaxID=2662263 RepID=UPI0013CF8A7B|nr:chondroitinase family polysaccharide lyase [Paraferrimonas sp. SM1919]
MNFRRTMTATAVILGLSIAPLAQAKKVLSEDILSQRISFEDAQSLHAIETNQHQLELSTKHFKDLSHSLAWKITSTNPLHFGEQAIPGLVEASSMYPGGQPEVYEPSYVNHSHQGGIKLWVYRDKPSNGSLTFEFKDSNNQAHYRAQMQQNYSGWRAFWVHLAEDAKIDANSANQIVNNMSITPSKELLGDTVHLDMLQFVTFVSRKRHSDWQYVNNKAKVRVDSYKILQPWQQLQKFDDQSVKLEQAHIDAFASIGNKLDTLILGSQTNHSHIKQADQYLQLVQEQLDKAESSYQALNIQRQGEGLTGQPLFSVRDEHVAIEGDIFQVAGQNTFFSLALDYKRQPTAAKKQRLLNLFEHFHDQGWAAGSSIGTTDHIIRLGFYAIGSWLFRDELAEAGMLTEVQQALLWHTRFGKLSNIDYSTGENTDHVRGGAFAKLISVLLMQDSPQKVALMQGYLDYLEWASDYAPSYSDTIKWDGSIYHHRSAYQNSYGIQSLTTLALIDSVLHGGAFQLSEQFDQRLKTALMQQFEFSADFQQHLGITGRFPANNSGIDRFMLPAYAAMAYKDPQQVDADLAMVFAQSYQKADLSAIHKILTPGLTYFGSFGTIETMENVYQWVKDNKPEALKAKRLGESGFYNKPYAGFVNMKTDNWVAQARGMSKYVWDFESGSKVENPFGRYQSFGALTLFSGEDEQGLLTLKASGMAPFDGFHWAYLPGATTKALPMEKTTYRVAAHPIYKEGKHRNYTENTFLGGVDNGNNGIFAMELTDTVPNDGDEPMFEPGFSFNKSFFFFEDQIIALGSRINSDDKQYSTITTLFQNLLNVKHPTTAQRNNQPLVGGIHTFEGGEFVDPQGNLYRVPSEYKVVAEQGIQPSLTTSSPKKGSKRRQIVAIEQKAVKAYIDHGKAPNNANYHYQIVPKHAQLERLPSYQLIANDSALQQVYEPQSKTMGYAIFDASAKPTEPIVATDTPIIAMTQNQGNRLTVAISDPDLRMKKWNHNMSFMPLDIVNGKEASKTVTITIDGHWNVAEHQDLQKIQHLNKQTQIQITLDKGKTRKLALQQL